MPDEYSIALASGDYGLTAAPRRGGAILAFTWRGQHLLRQTVGPGILDVACFPLVPYSNRICGGRFVWNGRKVALARNLSAVDPNHPLHGTGWLSEWEITGQTPTAVQLVHVHPGGDWPWPYRANLCYVLDEGGLTAHLAVTNLASEAMPAGLGFHPYFPRNEETRYLGLHRGEWKTDGAGFPVSLALRDRASDWWNDAPVGSRIVDTVYTGREGTLQVSWPDRDLALEIDPTRSLSCTAVYVPDGADWFCAEPVSHKSYALNDTASADAMTTLHPGATFEVAMRLQAHMLGQ